MVKIPTGSFKTLYVKPAGKDLKSSKNKPGGFEIEQADILLRKTGQYSAFVKLRRENDDKTLNVARLILKRHGMLENITNGGETHRQKFDSLTREIALSGIYLFDSSHFIKSNEIKQSLSLPYDSSSKEELILEMVYKNHILSNGVLALKDGKNTYFPLKAVSSLLGIDNELENGKIDSDRMIFEKNDKRIEIPDRNILMNKGVLYLSREAWKRFFNVDLSMDYSNMRISLLSGKHFPFMDRLKRMNNSVFSYKPGQNNFNLPMIENQYDLISPPVLDLNYNLGRESDEDHLSYGYSVKGRGDLLRTSANLYIRGDDKNNPERVELSAEKVNPGERKSSFDITRIAAGDIRHPSFSVFNTTDSEKGIIVEGKDFSRNLEFDSTKFQGNCQNGWDVELYRNKVLIGRAVSDEKGEFLFDDIPLYYGDNRFKLVYYGPDGEKREEEKVLKVGHDMEQPGKFSYSIALSEKNRKTITYENPEIRDSGKIRFSSGFTAGINENLTMEAGLRSEEVLSKRENYSFMGLVGSLGGILVKGDFTSDGKGGSSELISAQIRAVGTNFRLKHTRFDNFFMDGMNENDPDKSASEFSMSGLLLGNSRFPISWSLRDQYKDRENSYSNILSLREGITGKNSGLYNYNQWQKDNSTDTEEATGSLYQYFNIKDHRLRSVFDYNLSKGVDADKLSIEDEWKLKDNLSLNLGVNYDFNEKEYGFETSLPYDSGRYRITPRFTKNPDGSYEFWTGVSLSLGVDPHTGKLNVDSLERSSYGEISAFAYEDKNNNHSFDKGEKPIKGARIESFSTGRFAITDKDGIGSIKRMQPYRQAGIVLSEASLQEPDLVSSNRGNFIYPRPGKIQAIDFPVYKTAEFEGQLFIENEKGHLQNIPYQKIGIVSEDGKFKKEVISEYDGYFLIDRIPPGEYLLKVFDSKRGFDFSKKIKLSSENKGVKNIIIDSFEQKPDRIKNLVHKSSSKVLYENGKWLEGKRDTTIPDRSILMYDDGKWGYGNKVKGFGVHLASFQNILNAKKFIEQNKELFLSDAYIKKTDLGASGIWYRVVYGNFVDDKKALAVEKKMKSLFNYTDIIKFDS